MVEALQLDLGNSCLRQGASEIPLTPKALSVVEYLIANTGKIATKDALLDTVWANEDVSEYALTSIIRDLRRVLGDSTKNPRYIETVHRRGYRWIGNVSHETPDHTTPIGSVETETTAAPTTELTAAPNNTAIFTGRNSELAQLLQSFHLASQGKRQLVFLTGEAGIGKTSLIETFINQVSIGPNCSVTLGQCIEKYGAGEAYRPILEALNRFCLTTEGHPFISVLEQYAPSWLMQMPPLLTPDQLLRLQAQGLAPKERWLRELAEALDIITRDRQLVLILEDLHWSDPSTVELLDMLAHRQESARLMIIASYRPAEINGSNHPLKHTKQKLQLHSLCQEIALNYLDQQAIKDYLAQRFPHQFSPSNPQQTASIATKIHQRTEGNPLFIVNVVDSLIEKPTDSADAAYLNPQNLSSTTVPNNLQQLINLQFDALDPEKQKILETASVEGAEFLSVTVAANLNMESEQVELCIDDLVQLNHLITIDDVEILPDGNLSTRYRFIHALYQEGLYQRLAKNRRVRLHRALGTQLETIYGAEAPKIAAQLALHFEQGIHYGKAIHYRQQAGENALKRNAHAAAVEHLHQGLTLLPKVKDPTEQNPLEFNIQTLLGTALMTLKGQAAPEVGQAYKRAQTLCQHHLANNSSIPEQFATTLGLWRHTFISGNLAKSLELSQQCFALAEKTQTPMLLGNAHYAMASTLMYQGQLPQALTYADSGLTYYRQLTTPKEAALRHSQDPSATLMAYRSWILFFMGNLEQSRQGMDEMLALDVVQSHPQTTVSSLTYSGILYMYLREFSQAIQQLETAIQLAKEWYIPQFDTIATFFLNCALCLSEKDATKPAEMQKSLDIRRASGAELHATGYLNRIAEAYLAVNQSNASSATLSQIPLIIKQNTEAVFEADTYRLMGKQVLLTAVPQNETEAEILFQRSLAIAQQQQAKIFKLRAAKDLAQLWTKQGKPLAAKDLLTPIYNSFTEGFDFPDLQAAKQLIDSF